MIVKGYVCSGVAIGRRISVPTGTESECAMLNYSITVDSIQGRECEYRLPAMASATEAFWKFVSIAMDSSYEVLCLINDDDHNCEEVFAQRWMVDDGEVNLVKIYRRQGGQLLLELYQHRLLES